MNEERAKCQSLLTLINLSDTALPIGGYSHSLGLETWVQSDTLTTAEEVYSCLHALLVMTIGPQDGAACAIAHRYSTTREFGYFAKLNEQLSAARWTKETLKASVSMGERLYKLACDIELTKNQRDRLPKEIHHSAVFGWVAAPVGITASEATNAFIYSTLANLTSACVRLIPLGQTDGQKILAKLRPAIGIVSSACLDCDLDEIGGFAPLNECASIEHESLYSRLFQS